MTGPEIVAGTKLALTHGLAGLSAFGSWVLAQSGLDDLLNTGGQVVGGLALSVVVYRAVILVTRQSDEKIQGIIDRQVAEIDHLGDQLDAARAEAEGWRVKFVDTSSKLASAETRIRDLEHLERRHRDE